MIFHENSNQRRAWVAILISDKIDLKIKIKSYKTQRRTLYINKISVWKEACSDFWFRKMNLISI